MTKFKNVFLLAAMAVSAVCVSSCSDDEEEPGAAFDGKITATVSTGGVTIGSLWPQGMSASDLSTTAKYENNTLTIELLNPLPDGRLSKLTNLGAPDVDGFVLSYITAVNGNQPVGSFSQENDDRSIQAFYIYVAEDCTIKGISLKKGWNRVFVNAGADTATIAAPSGVKWVFKRNS
ncbi:hypothetical protein AGMMS49982_13920 [Bacteroidia bacterium]|nr:hypothetical protein AGMMS49982_13920 [Bacteroidia bacterium]